VKSCKQHLDALLSIHAGSRVNGSVASDRTSEAARDSLHASFSRLGELGFRLQNPENIGEKHIQALCNFWHQNGYKPKTIQGNLSQLRIFCRWIGKGDMVKNAAHYLPDVPHGELRVKTIADKSKSWVANGIDVAEKVREADAIDWRFGMMLRMAVAFGLRRMEVVQCIPWKVDRGDKFAAYKTKGGRPRDIYIDTNEQRKVLDQVKALLKPNEQLGWLTKCDGSKASLEFSLAKWNKMMAKIDITRASSNCTGHGLRAQYAENAALIADMIPPTLGGTGRQMPKGVLDLKRVQVSELLGHSRKSVTGAYYGSFGRDGIQDSPERTKLAIIAAIPLIPAEKLKEVSRERMNDCIRLTAELMTANAFVEPSVTHALWEHHSGRHCTDWLPPGVHNIAALEAAANHFAGLV
jgi:site-specific recombinase XerD